MALRDSTFGELKIPLTWLAAVAVIVAAIVALAFLLNDRRGELQAEAYGATRRVSDAVAAPVGGVLSTPLHWAGAGVETVRGYFFAVSENRRLKRELKQMREWRDLALVLKDTNERYRTLLGLKTDPPVPMATGRVITDARGAFSNTRLANVGKEAGVRVGNPVLSENGLVGRVVGVTTGASRILMLTDAASRVPVMVDRTNARAILIGDGGPNPKLEYLRGKEPVREGDRVVTSGDGGMLPRGLPVGTAVKGLDGRWRVVLASDAAPIDYVRILLFQDFTQLVNQAELNRPSPPPMMAPSAPGPGAAPGAAGAVATPPTVAMQPPRAAPAAPRPAATPAPPARLAPAPSAAPAAAAPAPAPAPAPATPSPESQEAAQ